MQNLALLAVPPPKAAGSRFWSLRAPGFGLCSSLWADTPTSEAAARRRSYKVCHNLYLPLQFAPLPASASSPSWRKGPALRASAEAALLAEVSCLSSAAAGRALPLEGGSGPGAPGAALVRGCGRRRVCREPHARRGAP